MPAPRKFKVGDTVWFFDSNHRVYDKSKSLSPVFEKYYIEHQVSGFKGRSYLIARNYDERLGYANLYSFSKAERMFCTTEEKDEIIYCHDHSLRIAEMVRHTDAGTLKRVAEVLGYQ